MSVCNKQYFAERGMRSERELVIERWLVSLGYEPFHDRRYGFEIDIALKVGNRVIGLEFNGVRFHCSATARRTRGITLKAKDYHYNKTLMALKQGIELLHFWDFEPIKLVQKQILDYIDGKCLSEHDVDKNPALITNAVLIPQYVFTEDTGFHKSMVPFKNKPINWKSLKIQCYEFYTSGYVV